MTPRKTALLGAEGLCGKSLLERLREAHLPVGRIALAEPGGDAGVLSAVGGELVVSTPLVDEALEDADLVLCCCPLPDDAREAVRALSRRAVVIDVDGSLEAPPVDARRATSLGPGLHGSPSGAALLLASLGRSARAAGARGPLVATVLEAASELGQPALDELYRQAVAILNFSPVPTDVLGRQVVHDVASPVPGGSAREARLRRDVAALGGGDDVRLLCVQAGTFHGVAVAAHAEVAPKAWERALQDERGVALALDEPASPLTSVRSETAVVGRLEDDGRGGAWVWSACDTLAQGAVGNAVRLVELLTGAAAAAGRRGRTP